MAYDEELAGRIRELAAGEAGLTEKKMFGGLAFLIGGNMAVAASGQGGMMVRVDPDESETLLATTNARLVEMRGPADAGLDAGRLAGRPHRAATCEMGRARRRLRPLAAREAVIRPSSS